MFTSRLGWVALVFGSVMACSSSNASDAGAPDAQSARVAQGPACKEYLRCLASGAPEAVGPAVGAYGPESGCWGNAETAALCEQACTDSRARAGCGGADGGSEGGSDSGASNTTYFVTCLTVLSVGDLSKRLNFVAKDAWTFRSLKATATRVDLAETVGDAYKATVRMDASATTLQLGTMTIPAAANPISGRDILLEAAAFAGNIKETRSCVRMSGYVTSPIRQPIDPATDTCVLVAVRDGDPIPRVDLAEHGCK